MPSHVHPDSHSRRGVAPTAVARADDDGPTRDVDDDGPFAMPFALAFGDLLRLSFLCCCSVRYCDDDDDNDDDDDDGGPFPGCEWTRVVR